MVVRRLGTTGPHAPWIDRAGSQAGAWLAEERERLARYINDSQALGGDGGYAADGVAQLLPRPDLIRMLQQFFSNTSWGEEV